MSIPFSQGSGSSTDGLPTDSLYPVVVATVSVCAALTTIFTAARLIAKSSYSSFNVEDYLSIVTWLLYVGLMTCIMLQTEVGFGQHIWNVNLAGLPRLGKISYAIEIFYCPVTWFAKAALLFQLQRTFAPNKNGIVYIVCQILIWVNAMAYLSSLISILAQCTPVRKVWDHTVDGHCIDMNAVMLATSVINIISDLLILILPIWAIFHLRMPLKKKFSISAIFATGLLAITCSICRFVYTFPLLHTTDITYQLAQQTMWSLGEIASIILCTCFPLMARFRKIILHKSKSTKSSLRYIFHKSDQSALSSSTDSEKRTPSTHQGCHDCKSEHRCIVHELPKGSFSSTENDDKDIPMHPHPHPYPHVQIPPERTRTSDATLINTADSPDTPHADAYSTNDIEKGAAVQHKSMTSTSSNAPETDARPQPLNSKRSTRCITVHREVQVWHGVHADQLETDCQFGLGKKGSFIRSTDSAR